MRTDTMRSAAWILAVGALVGCKGQMPANKTPATNPGKIAASVPSGELEDQLKSALYQLQPEHLNIDSRLDDAVSVLNNWWTSVKEAGLRPEGLTLPELPASRLTESQRDGLQRDHFNAEDGRVIHAAYLAKAIAEQATDGASHELDRIVRLFEWTCRNIALEADDSSQRPGTLYEVLIMGHGSPADRAWVFAALLKQQRWDLVILHPADMKLDTPDAAWLAGVVHDGEIYLFDMRLGLPVPKGQELDRPATLRDLLAHPEWLAALTPRADQPYEPSVEQLQSAQVSVYAVPTMWAPRMWSVEQLLPGESLCVLYDPAGQLGDAPGLFDRVASAGDGWSADQIAVWSYPGEREALMTSATPKQMRLLEVQFVPFLMPVVVQPAKGKAPAALVNTLQQLSIRTDQLYGRRAQAVSQYVTIRQLAVTPPPAPELAPLYQQAADDAYYFSCLCKFEGKDYPEAAKSLADYVKKSRRSGRWGAAARSLLADAHAAQGDIEAASQTIRAQESDDPYRARHAVLIARWSGKQKASEKPATTAP